MLIAEKNPSNAIEQTASEIIKSLHELTDVDLPLTRNQRRQLNRSVQKFVKKNKLHVTTTLNDASEVKEFILNVFDGEEKASEDAVKVSVKFLRQQHQDKQLDTQPRSYQREKVADYDWKCEIIHTILIDTEFKMPAIHIRILRDDDNNVLGYEIADGQQRVTAILEFMDGEFKLPDHEKYGKFRGMSYAELVREHDNDSKDLNDYGISTTFYDNFSDGDIATLFIKILNNVNDLNVQEKNNATRSRLADFVRYTSRNGNGKWLDTADMFHELFSRDELDKGTPKERQEWKYFNNLGIGRMEGDQWLASLIYLYLIEKWSSGVTPTKLFNFYQETSDGSHDLGWNFKDKLSTKKHSKLESNIIKLLNIGLKISKYVLKHKNKSYLKPNFMLFAILFGNDYKQKLNAGSVDWNSYSKKLLEVWDKWDTESVFAWKEIIKNGKSEKVIRYQNNGKTPMGPFKALWGSLNTNVILTAKNIIEMEMSTNPDGWGFVELDSRKTFPKHLIEKRWKENGGICDYTGEKITLDEAVGDHDIPRSWGIKKGGVTEYHNLKITTAYHNGQKLTMTGEAYRLKLREVA